MIINLNSHFSTNPNNNLFSLDLVISSAHADQEWGYGEGFIGVCTGCTIYDNGQHAEGIMIVCRADPYGNGTACIQGPCTYGWC